MELSIFVQLLVLGLVRGSMYALMGVGLSLIFGIMEIVNFAHGEFLMIGMYTGLLTAQATGIDPLLTLPFAAIVGFLLGVLCYTGFVKFLLRGPMIAQLLGTFGLMLLLRNLALLIFGSEDRALHHGLLVGKSFDIGMGVILPATKLAAAGLSVVAFGGVWLLMHRTRAMAMEDLMDDHGLDEALAARRAEDDTFPAAAEAVADPKGAN